MTEEKKAAPKKEAPRKRKGGAPLGVHHAKLSVPDGLIPKDKVGRWINDVDNRLSLAQGSDWEFVLRTDASHVGGGNDDRNTDIGSKISQVVGSDKTGDPMRAYLMMKWKDWHEEDQAKKQERADSIDEAIGTPGFGASEKGLDNNQMYGKMKYKA